MDHRRAQGVHDTAQVERVAAASARAANGPEGVGSRGARHHGDDQEGAMAPKTVSIYGKDT